MKTVVLYREKSEQARAVEAFLRDYESLTRLRVEKVEIDSRAGSEMAKLYGVTDYPAVLVTRVDGQLIQMWQGMQLPPIEEVQHAASS
jgi:hypothetical protein